MVGLRCRHSVSDGDASCLLPTRDGNLGRSASAIRSSGARILARIRNNPDLSTRRPDYATGKGPSEHISQRCNLDRDRGSSRRRILLQRNLKRTVIDRLHCRPESYRRISRVFMVKEDSGGEYSSIEPEFRGLESGGTLCRKVSECSATQTSLEAMLV